MKSSLLTALIVLVTTQLSAQWSADIGAGWIDYQLPEVSRSPSLTLGLRYFERGNWAYLAGGSALNDGGLPWGAGGAGTRLFSRLAGQDVGVETGAEFYGYRDATIDVSGIGVVAEALPMIGFNTRSTRWEIQSGVRIHSQSTGGTGDTRALWESGLRVTQSIDAALFSGRGSVVVDEFGAHPHLEGRVQVAIADAWITGSIGRWSGDTYDGTEWRADAFVPLNSRFALSGGVERRAVEPLFTTGAQEKWFASLSVAVGRSRRFARSLPVPVVRRTGEIVIRTAAPRTSQPRIAGDFTDWEPRELTRDGDHWQISLQLSPGVYRYAFVDDQGNWYVPDDLPGATADGFGGENAVLVVSGE